MDRHNFEANTRQREGLALWGNGTKSLRPHRLKLTGGRVAHDR